jgi:plasmid stabilization system protein ParE
LEEYKIKWTSRAVKDLRKIYNFYSEQLGENMSINIIQSLLNKVDILSDPKFVEIGAEDEQFNHLKRTYKKLIEQNVKITYRIGENSIVYINRVFDTRQNPNKNK